MAFKTLLCATALTVAVTAQTFQRLGACPKLGCIFPPDQAEFFPGALFDVRVEVHAPVNGSEAAANGVPDKDYTLTVAKDGQAPQPASDFFAVKQPRVDSWDFTYYEDLFAQDAETPIVVNVAGSAYRKISLTEPGVYTATLTYYNGNTTVAQWLVRDVPTTRRAKNVVLFIGDGMTTNMITAARLIGHKSVNGKYQSTMALDKFPTLGHQMTHSVDSYITDSANSATALYTGHKSTVNSLGSYADSSPDPFDDPKLESIAELFQRITCGGVGIVSTAVIADATPAALAAHTRNRDLAPQIVDAFLRGQTNYTWTNWTGPDVLLGGGAEQFFPGEDSFNGEDYYRLFSEAGYNVVLNKTALPNAPSEEKLLGIFSQSNMAKWLDRNVYKGNLEGNEDAPDGKGGDAVDQPGQKEMTLKALDILSTRHKEKGFFLMSEAASIDKMMHALDYDRALGDLLELDNTVDATMQYLERTGQLEETLVLVTADHGHGFDVMGSADTKYLQAQDPERKKRNAIGTYQNSGESQYTVAYPDGTFDQRLVYSEGAHFPTNWDPRYTLFDGLRATPDTRENYTVHKGGPREPAQATSDAEDDYVESEDDGAGGFKVSGTLPLEVDQGVHSLTDVPVFSHGPCEDLFKGVYNSIDIFFGMAECLGLSQAKGGSGADSRSRGSKWGQGLQFGKEKGFGPSTPSA